MQNCTLQLHPKHKCRWFILINTISQFAKGRVIVKTGIESSLFLPFEGQIISVRSYMGICTYRISAALAQAEAQAQGLTNVFFLGDLGREATSFPWLHSEKQTRTCEHTVSTIVKLDILYIITYKYSRRLVRFRSLSVWMQEQDASSLPHRIGK